MNEEIILDRDRVECIIDNLTLLMKVESHCSSFKFRLTTAPSGEKTLTIFPKTEPIEISLNYV